MKRLTIMNRIFGFLIGSILALILILSLPLQGCKSVRKSQIEKSESTTVKKSDSSSSKSYSYTDTTKTDSSTTITKTEVTIDSVEYDYKYLIYGPELLNDDGTGIITFDTITAPSRKAKAKGIKITTTVIKQAATQAKGVTIKEDVKQADIKTDEKFAKRELSKETTKKPSISMGIGLVFGIVILIGLIWVVIWVWRKKRSAVKTIAGKIF